MYVFDIRQTEGKDLPALTELQGEVSGYRKRLVKFVEAQNVKLNYLLNYEEAFAPLTRGRLTQACEANSSESCTSKFRFISSSDSPVGGPEGLKTQAHSEQPHPSKFCISTHTNLRDELSWPL